MCGIGIDNGFRNNFVIRPHNTYLSSKCQMTYEKNLITILQIYLQDE